MLGSPAGPGAPTQRGLWPLAPAPTPTATPFATDGFGKCGVYSLFPGGSTFGSALYSHASTIGRFAASSHIQQSATNPFHTTTHKVSDSLFSSTGYTFGAPTPPPGSPYSPVPVAQLELLAKSFNSNIIIQQPPPALIPPPPTSTQPDIDDGVRCEQKCCATAKICGCRRKIDDNGCARTYPTDWCVGGNGINIKKEPTPCQVAEISTSASPMVKIEATSPKTDINVGLPIAATMVRQKYQQDIVGSPSLPPIGLLTTVNTAAQFKEVARVAELDASSATSLAAGMAAGTTGGGTAGGTLLQCTDERATALAGWTMGGTPNPTLTTPTLWQYPAPVPMEPMVPFPVPMPPVGFQLVRDPTTGSLLLLPATAIEPLQQAVVWPGYHQPPSVLLPPLPPPPLQLLGSTSSSTDYLTSSTTLHQHTQTHSTRLVAVTTTDNSKRKIPLPIPTTTLIKIETDATLHQQDQTKNTTNVYTTDQPLVTAHVIYQHPTTNLILSSSAAPAAVPPPPPSITAATANQETMCRSQATSPVADCLTPPPENVAALPEKMHENVEEQTTVDVGNQTDTPPMEMAVEESAGVEKDEETKRAPDLSGLELLSNSICALEDSKCEHGGKVQEESVKNDNFGGLDLLCALAEQRIMEENVEKTRKKEKRKLRKLEELKKKRPKTNECRQCHEDNYHKYKTKESEEEVRRFLASKQTANDQPSNDFPKMDTNELDMRMRLADIQRQYRESQDELNRLKPKRNDCPIKKRPTITLTPPPTPQLPPSPVKQPNDNVKNADVPNKIETAPKLVGAIKQSDRIIANYLRDQQALEEESSLIIPEKNRSASKKRKVGRPKKFSSPGKQVQTETIVAKKPKNIVGYLLAAKEKLKLQQTSVYPPKYLDDNPGNKAKKLKINHNNNEEEDDVKKSCKIRPKLKAEPTVKNYAEDDEDDGQLEDDVDETMEIEIEDPNSTTNTKESKCILTPQHLAIDKLRVLTAMGGLFYAGHLNAVEPPDVYSITLDGERGNRPHIMSREEILRDAIVEVSPKSTEELAPGTRLCAYWSQQYRCLYPGSVAEPGTPDPELDARFVSVEFDDGDSGRIALDDIRLLPEDYPIMEYDPNPLLSLSKRRRRASTSVSTEERRIYDNISIPTPIITSLPAPSTVLTPNHELGKENKDANTPDCDGGYERERKRAKKKKRDKLKQKLLMRQYDEERRKRKKHRCLEEHCKHKKHHKKHRKHHRRHHHHRRFDEEKSVNGSAVVVGANAGSGDSGAASAQEQPSPAVEDVLPTREPEANEEEDEDEEDDEPEIVANPEDEVTMDDIVRSVNKKSKSKIRDRQESCESRSKMSAFLPARQLWGWSGKGYKRPKAKGRARKHFYKAIQRGKETITVGDAAVFLSTGRPDRPYIGKIEAMWEMCGKMAVKVKWFYHPEETIGCPSNLQYPGALFESPHLDENDVQTISHKCEVLPLIEYRTRLGDDPANYASIYDNNDIYYLAGAYDPFLKVLKMRPEIPFKNDD